jgi:hypothetical protein
MKISCIYTFKDIDWYSPWLGGEGVGVFSKYVHTCVNLQY